MKKNNIKPLVMSALTALAMGAVGTVGTFALFTDKAETEVSIGSGTVKIGTVATLVKYQSSVDGTNQDLTGETSYVNTLVGSSFGLDGNTINISKMVPGDKLTLRVVSRNESDIKTKIRYVISHAKVGTKKDLFPALKVNFEPENNATVADLFRWTQHDAAPSGGEEIHSTLVTVEFPNHGFEITSRDEGIDNQYQDAACSISFALEAVQANATLDPIEEINAYLKAELFFEGHNDTMHDAVIDMAEIGYTSLSVLDGYVYEYAEDRFVAADSVTSDYHKYFKAVSNQTAAGNFSIYAANDWSDATVSLSGIGFDAGNASGIEQVNYIRTGVLDEKDVLIRTNSLDTSVTINAPNDVVTHYGEAQQVSIIAVKGSSYHEYGKVLFVDVSTGRIALEATSEVERVHFNVQDDKKTFESIVVAYDESLNALPEFSRDAVSEIKDEGTLVVELQKGTEVTEQTEKDYVYLYQQGLKEQIRVTSQQNATAEQVAQAPVSTDASVAPKTKTAAEQISNSIIGGSYTAEQIAAGEVDADDVADRGIAAQSAQEKQQIIQSLIEERISEIALDDDDHDYVARIGSKFYESFDAAFAAVSEGKTIRIIGNCEGHGDYDTLGRNLNILVEENKTIDFGSFINQRFTLSGTGASALTFEGLGTMRFHGNADHGLVSQLNSSDNIKIIMKDLTVISDGAAGYIADGNVVYKSGVFENIIFNSAPQALEGGLFNFDFSDYLPDGKMAALIDATHYAIADLDEAHSNFILTKANEETFFYRTLAGALKNAEFGDLVEARLPNGTYNVANQKQYVSVESSGITIDLKGGTLNAVAAPYYAFHFSSLVSFTLKNAILNANKFGTLSATQAGHISFQNVQFKDGMTGVEEAIGDGYNYFKDTDTEYFTYVVGEPEAYALSVVRASKNSYYAGSEAFETVFGNLADHDEIYLNADPVSDIVVPIGLTIVVEWASDLEEPNVVKDEEADLLITEGLGANRKSYFAKSEVVAKVVNNDQSTTSFKDLHQAFQSLEKNPDAVLTLLDDVNLNGSPLKIVNSKIASNPPMQVIATFDLNGKTITSNSNVFDIRLNTGCSITFVDNSESKTGRVVCTSAEASSCIFNLTNTSKMDSAHIYLNGGTFEHTGPGNIIRSVACGYGNTIGFNNESWRYCARVHVKTTLISSGLFLGWGTNISGSCSALNQSVIVEKGGLVRYQTADSSLAYRASSTKNVYVVCFGYNGTATTIDEGEFAGYLSVS